LVPAQGEVVFISDGVSNWNSLSTPNGGGPMIIRDDGAVVEVFIDGVNGDDTLGDGLSPGTALATLRGLYRKFPWQAWEETSLLVNLLNPNPVPLTYVIPAVRLGGGNVALGATYAFRGPAMTLFDPATGPSSAALDAVPAVRVDQAGAPSGTGNRTRLDFTAAAPAWTVNDLAGSFVRVTRGAVQVFWEIPIVENTADTITVDTLGIVGVLLNTDTVEIVEPAVRIDAPAAAFEILNIVGDNLMDGVAGATAHSTFERVGFSSVWSRASCTIQFDRCQFRNSFFGCQFFGSAVSFSNCAAQAQMILAGSAAAEAIRRPNAGGNPISLTAALTDLQHAPRVGQLSGGIQIGNPKSAFSPRQSGTYVAHRSLSSYR
jgi:hypothetical protein